MKFKIKTKIMNNRLEKQNKINFYNNKKMLEFKNH